MISFILFILVFFLVIGLVIVSTVFGFIRSIFNFGKRANQAQQSSQSQQQDFEQPATKAKIFDKKEGEYVDFEEIKE